MKPIIVLVLPLFLAVSTLAHSDPANPGHDHATAPAGEHSHDDGHHHHDEDAEEALRLAREETAVDYMWRKSDEAFHAGEYERAIGLHAGIVALEPGIVDSYGNAAWLLWSLDRGEEAVAFIERGLKANPDNWAMWREAAQHYGLQKLSEKERDAYVRAVELMPADEDKVTIMMVRRALAHAAEKSGALALSVSTWRQLVKDYPEDAVNKNNLARVEKRLQDQTSGGATQARLPLSGMQTMLALAGLPGALLLPAALIARRVL